MEILEAYILAGGKGERLKPLTIDTPKPLLPVKGKPILEWNIERLKEFGAEKIVIGIGHLGEKIEAHLGSGERLGVEIKYMKEEIPLGTGGAVKHASELLGERFFMINGDNLADFDYSAMTKVHEENRAEATIALYEVEDVSSFGVARMDAGKIVEFVEKPEEKDAPSKLINAGAYVLEKRTLSLMPNGFCLIEKELFPRLAAHGKLYGYRHRGQWFPTDTMERYEKVEAEWKGF